MISWSLKTKVAGPAAELQSLGAVVAAPAVVIAAPSGPSRHALKLQAEIAARKAQRNARPDGPLTETPLPDDGAAP